MQRKIKEISFNGQPIFIGIDAHAKSWKVTIMVDEVMYNSYSQDPSAKVLRTYLDRNFPGGSYYSVYEAGFCGFSMHRELEENGIQNIIVNPADIPTTDKERNQKEDRRDSRKLCRSLRNGELQCIYIHSIEIEELRALLRYRRTLVKEIARHKNRIKSFLYFKGATIPMELAPASNYWSNRFTLWLQSINMATVPGNVVLQETIETVIFLRKKLLKLTRTLRQIENNPDCTKAMRLLRSLPGFGLIVSFTFLTEIGEMKRFKSLDTLCSYVGLIPRTSSSGEKENVGSITQRSNKPLRSSIIEAAWVAIRNDPALSLKYIELRKRMDANKAIVRIAKKLLSRLRYVINNEIEYVHSVV